MVLRLCFSAQSCGSSRVFSTLIYVTVASAHSGLATLWVYHSVSVLILQLPDDSGSASGPFSPLGNFATFS